MYFLEWVEMGDYSKYTVETFVCAELEKFRQLQLDQRRTIKSLCEGELRFNGKQNLVFSTTQQKLCVYLIHFYFTQTWLKIVFGIASSAVLALLVMCIVLRPLRGKNFSLICSVSLGKCTNTWSQVTEHFQSAYFPK